MIVLHMMIEEDHNYQLIIVKRLLMKNKIHTWLLMKIKCAHDCSRKKSTLSIIRPRYSRLINFYQNLQNVWCLLFHFNGNTCTSYVTTSTLNTKYIWAVLIKLHDSATYDDRRKSYEWLKHQALKCNLSLVYPRTVVLVS
jgi:hypothetical protein